MQQQHEHYRVDEDAEVRSLAGGVGSLQTKRSEYRVRQLVYGWAGDYDEEKRGDETLCPGEGHDSENVVLRV